MSSLLGLELAAMVMTLEKSRGTMLLRLDMIHKLEDLKLLQKGKNLIKRISLWVVPLSP